MRKIWMAMGVAVLCAAAGASVARAQSGEVVPAEPQGSVTPAPSAMPSQQTPTPRAVPLESRRAPGGAFGGAPRAMPGVPPRPDLGKWWKNSEIAKEIGLTEQQVTRIEQTFYEHRLQLIDLNADVERNEARLQPLMEADALEEAKISTQLDQLLAARSRLEKANMMMMISIRKVLSIEQWKKLEEIRDVRLKLRTRYPMDLEVPPGAMKRKQPAPLPPDEENR